MILAKVEKMNPFCSHSDFEDLAGHALILADVVLLPERGMQSEAKNTGAAIKRIELEATTLEAAFTTRGKHDVRRF